MAAWIWYSWLFSFFVTTIGVTQLSAILTQNGVYLPWFDSKIDRIFLAKSLKFLKNRRYPTIGVNQLSAILNYLRHLHKMALTRLDLIMKL
jgi:hypothetical protein